MSAVNVTNITVLNNPSSFLSPLKFEITYDCVNALKEALFSFFCLNVHADLEWKLIYVGSAEDDTYDQLLESVFVGPVNVGGFRFVLQADPPDPARIRAEDILGVTVLLLTCSYMGQEFVRIGYYVNNDYNDENLRQQPPQTVKIDMLQRNILTDKPRVTKFPINFHPENSETGEQGAAPPPDDNTAKADGNEE
ncbi:hypothetical protein H5410_006441 [Solanum commersonii]|uniref:Histone chaperone ASF1A n=1 Tax=Solanum commersonii TaxID=4109 RepID=A0A9J6ABC0_SOLCO|nr:hypothetical protein H5410_006441 [Solanum commersonii]